MNIKHFFGGVIVLVLLPFYFSGCVKERKPDYLITPPPPPPPPPRVIPTHRVAEDVAYRLGKWGWQVPAGQEWRGTDTIHFRTDSTMSWFLPLGIQKYRFDRFTFRYEWKDFVSPHVEWHSTGTRFDTLNEILYVTRGQERRPYKKVR